MASPLAALAAAVGILVAGAGPALATSPGVRGLIAFDVPQAGGGIWTTTGGEFPSTPTQIAATGFRPTWSPDGTKIAYVTNFPDDVWLMNADGSGKTRLTFDARRESSPSWSPDGTRLAFAGTEAGSGARLKILTLGRGEPATIGTRCPEIGDASWSPVGDVIAFVCEGASRSIWTIRADGSGERQVTFPSPSERHFFPDWRPDGSRILFVRSGADGNQVFSMRPDGSDVAPIGMSTTSGAMWAPEGNGVIGSTTLDAGGGEIDYGLRSIGLDALFFGRVEYDAGLSLLPFFPAWQPVGPLPGITGVGGALTAGSSGATITVDGVRFVPRSVVRWNGEARPTTFVSSTRLEARLGAADLSSAGAGRVSVFTSPTGGGSSADLDVAIAPSPPAPPPPRLSISAATWYVAWRQSTPQGRVIVTGSTERAGTVEIALLRGSRVSLRAVVRLPAGRFTQALRVRGQLLPGRYTVRLREPSPPPGVTPLAEVRGELVLKAPPEGVVSRARISTIGPQGPAAIRTPRAARLYARFTFAAPARRGTRLSTQWYRDGKAVPDTRIVRPRTSQVDAVVRAPTRLPSGRWRCVLRADRTTVATATIRVG